MTPISLWASFKAKRSMAPGTLLDVATKARITKQLSGYIPVIRYLGECKYIGTVDHGPVTDHAERFVFFHNRSATGLFRSYVISQFRNITCSKGRQWGVILPRTLWFFPEPYFQEPRTIFERFWKLIYIINACSHDTPCINVDLVTIMRGFYLIRCIPPVQVFLHIKLHHTPHSVSNVLRSNERGSCIQLTGQNCTM